MKSVKIVKSVDYTFCTALSGMRQSSARTVRLPAGVEWHEVRVKPYPSMVSSAKAEDKNRVVTTTLKLFTPDDLHVGRRRLAFRVTLVGGRQFLVGGDRRPYPVVEIAENCPTAAADSQLNEVTVTYRSLHIPPYIAE